MLTVVYVQVLRKKLEECYATNGVNHFEECTEIRKKYLQATKVRTIGVGCICPLRMRSMSSLP